ncbi:MAG TPA: glycosyltransferase family 39 protein [Phototrophicaceae bacterium]|nr:glycosyltransferase family 39 protein [Phototrophicaceae bacterium]
MNRYFDLSPQSSSLSPFRIFVPLLIILVGAAIQFRALVVDVRFYPDEAFFSTFARNAALDGDWLLHGDLDKTPLAIYADALSMNFVAARGENGVLNFDPKLGEFAARLPSALASLALIAISYALAQQLYGNWLISAWAGMFVACSPYLAIYGATAYTDGLMLTFGALALLLAARGRWLGSGAALALAFASKQQAVYFLPLVFAIGWVMNRLRLRGLLAFFGTLIVGVVVLILWDRLRDQPTSLWALAAANNNPARLLRADEVVPRLIEWLNYARTLVGTPTILLAIVASIMIGVRISREARRRATVIDVLLLIFILGYLLINWLVAFDIYPRYLLILLVPAALLAARASIWLWNWLKPRLSPQEGVVLAAVLALVLLNGANGAADQRASYSEDGSDYSGIIDLADTLNAQTLGAVVYDHWLGWELGYYMGQWTDKRRVYYPTPEALVADALKLKDPAPRYFVAPTNQPIDPWLEQLKNAGFAVSQFYLHDGFVIYRLIPPSGA